MSPNYIRKKKENTQLPADVEREEQTGKGKRSSVKKTKVTDRPRQTNKPHYRQPWHNRKALWCVYFKQPACCLSISTVPQERVPHIVVDLHKQKQTCCAVKILDLKEESK